jgi:hypothetical protein
MGPPLPTLQRSRLFKIDLQFEFARFPLEALPDANLIPAFLGELLAAVIFSVASPKWEMTSLPANLRCQA